MAEQMVVQATISTYPEARYVVVQGKLTELYELICQSYYTQRQEIRADIPVPALRQIYRTLWGKQHPIQIYTVLENTLCFLISVFLMLQAFPRDHPYRLMLVGLVTKYFLLGEHVL
jgi:hypothetical protein